MLPITLFQRMPQALMMSRILENNRPMEEHQSDSFIFYFFLLLPSFIFIG